MSSSTFGFYSPRKTYLKARGFAAFNEITNSRFKRLIREFLLKIKTIIESMTYTIGEFIFINNNTYDIEKRYKVSHFQRKMREQYAALYKGFRSGIIWGRNWVLKRNRIIDIYKAPLLNQGIIEGCISDFDRSVPRLSKKL